MTQVEWRAALDEPKTDRHMLELHFLREISNSIKLLPEFKGDRTFFWSQWFWKWSSIISKRYSWRGLTLYSLNADKNLHIYWWAFDASNMNLTIVSIDHSSFGHILFSGQISGKRDPLRGIPGRRLKQMQMDTIPTPILLIFGTYHVLSFHTRWVNYERSRFNV